MAEEIKKEVTLIDQANLAAERIEKANAELKLLLDREEQINAKKILGGRSEAGVITPAIDPEEQKKADMRLYFKGTAIEKLIK